MINNNVFLRSSVGSLWHDTWGSGTRQDPITWADRALYRFSGVGFLTRTLIVSNVMPKKHVIITPYVLESHSCGPVTADPVYGVISLRVWSIANYTYWNVNIELARVATPCRESDYDSNERMMEYLKKTSISIGVFKEATAYVDQFKSLCSIRLSARWQIVQCTTIQSSQPIGKYLHYIFHIERYARV